MSDPGLMSDDVVDDGRFDRLRATATFADAAHEHWMQATLAVVGVGVLGSLFAREASRSGTHIDLYDFDIGEAHNKGNQPVEVGEPKAEASARLCNSNAPGSARAHVADIRQVGAGPFGPPPAAPVRCGFNPGNQQHVLSGLSLVALYRGQSVTGGHHGAILPSALRN